jgi:hypothetical protein
VVSLPSLTPWTRPRLPSPVASHGSLVQRKDCLSAGASWSFPSSDRPGNAPETCHDRTVPGGAVSGGLGFPTKVTASVAV